MAVSLNSVVGFNSKKLYQQQQLTRCYVQGSTAITVTSWRRRKLESFCLSSVSSSAAAENDFEESVAAPVDENSSSNTPFDSDTRLRRTARERLRAARKYSEAKAASPKSEMGTNVLNAIRESEGGKRRRSRLPEAPTNMLDDSKRGMPKQGLTFDFPGGFDLFVILVSFVLISTIMFATTYFVWKVGAIHFND